MYQANEENFVLRREKSSGYRLPMLVVVHIVDIKYLLCVLCCTTVEDTLRTNTQTKKLRPCSTSFQKTGLANIYKCRYTWLLSTPPSHSGDCWVMRVDWDRRTGDWEILLISLHSLRWFDEERGLAALLWQLLSEPWLSSPVPSWSSPCKILCPWITWAAARKTVLKFVLGWKWHYHFRGWASTQLYFFTVAETWKQIKEGKNSLEAVHFVFVWKGTWAKN